MATTSFLFAIAFLAVSASRPLAAQTPSDSVVWRRAMVAEVAKFLHHEAPRGGLKLVTADSGDSRRWSAELLVELQHSLDSLKLRTPGDSVTNGSVTFSAPVNFEQPYGGIPKQLLQLQMTESTCIAASGVGQGYYSGATYTVRLFTRGFSYYADINFLETADGNCAR